MDSKKYEIPMLVKSVASHLEKEVNNTLRQLDVTISQLIVLSLLYQEDSQTLSLKEIEKKLKVAQSTTVGIVSRLEKKKLIETVSDISDKRAKLAKITEKGCHLWEKAEEIRKVKHDYIASALSNQEREQFVILLTKINESIWQNEAQEK